jgi:hypothetical protein
MRKVLKKQNVLKFMSIFIMLVIFSGCNDDDQNNYHDYHLEYIGVIDAEVPDEFNYGSTYRIDVTIELPNSCYYYYDQYEYFYEGTSRLIYPIAHVDDGVACAPDIRTTTFSIPVQVLQSEPYIFKFYQGEDADGQDIFLTIEVPVV